MKFTKCVIGSNYTPVGFVYVAGAVERYEDFASLCRRNASDGVLYFSESGVFGLYNHSENTVEICRETVGGGYSAPIDPSITLTQRIISGGKVVGFVMKDATGTEVKKHIASILSAAKYMKPTNFKVVERDGNQFLQGKGVRLVDLPAMELTPGMTTRSKPKTVRTEAYDVVDPKLAKGISLVRLVTVIGECGGSILKMPKDDYLPIGDTHTEDGTVFTRVKSACEISAAVLDSATKKLSASFNYRVPGSVMTSEGPALAYIFRKKNVVNFHYEDGVLRGDKVRLGRIGVAVPKANVQQLYAAIAGTVSITPLEDSTALNTAVKLIHMQEPVLLAVDLAEISILGPEYADYLMAGVQIKDALVNINKYKYVSAFLKQAMSGIKANMPPTGPAPVWNYYSRFSPNALAELRDMGVDITSGIYTDTTKKQSTNASAVDKSADVEIMYELEDGLETPKDASAVLAMKLSDIPEAVRSMLSPFVSENDPWFKLKLAEDLKNHSDAASKKLETQLLTHKLAMLLDGNNAVHGHDKSEWSSATVRANAQFTKYTHDSGVVLKLRQIAFSK